MNLTFIVNQSTDIVFEHLSNMQKFVSVHPVITKIEQLSNNSYKVHETLNIFFIPISFKYPLIIEQNNAQKKVLMQANVMKLMKIELSFTVQAHRNFTSIEEHISFKSVLPIKFVLEQIFRKQHARLFQNIEALK